ncbi:MAG: QueT transporter family protein [Intestinibacter sp.]|uniref:QueT transporter family protein n=1 Tax=Intestinibacter sp. TaxID=1965304 RepID=UPI0025BC1B87|nr:QueT transporter family protein [Intestinibacter sp.]MCI6736660.1 QueT transporter family protein [Intestinibacter sp.]
MNTDRIVKTAIVAAIYAALTIGLSPLSYGPIQFRLSEVLILLAFVNSDYIVGLTIGCLIANLLGPYGLADIAFGTFATLVSAYLVNVTPKLIKNKYAIWVASLWPVLANAVIVGLMLNIFFKLPFLLCMLEVGIGEFGVVTVVGVPLFKLVLSKYPGFLNFKEA